MPDWVVCAVVVQCLSRESENEIQKRLKRNSQSDAVALAWHCGKYSLVTCLEQHVAPQGNTTIRQWNGSSTNLVYLRVALWMAKPPIERHT